MLIQKEILDNFKLLVVKKQPKIQDWFFNASKVSS